MILVSRKLNNDNPMKDMSLMNRTSDNANPIKDISLMNRKSDNDNLMINVHILMMHMERHEIRLVKVESGTYIAFSEKHSSLGNSEMLISNVLTES